MENANWIKLNPTIIENQLCCKLQFQEKVDVILTNEDVQYLIKELTNYTKAIEMVENIVCEN